MKETWVAIVGLLGILTVIVGLGRIGRTTPDILVPGMHPTRRRLSLNNLTIVWAGFGVISLASLLWTIGSNWVWLSIAQLLVWAALGVGLRLRIQETRNTTSDHPDTGPTVRRHHRT